MKPHAGALPAARPDPLPADGPFPVAEFADGGPRRIVVQQVDVLDRPPARRDHELDQVEAGEVQLPAVGVKLIPVQVDLERPAVGGRGDGRDDPQRDLLGLLVLGHL